MTPLAETTYPEPWFLVRPEEREILGRAHLDRDRAERINDRRPEGHERQRRRKLRLEDLFFALVASHAMRRESEGRKEAES